VSARLPNLDAILKRHRIHRKFWPEFRGMVEQRRLKPGKQPDPNSGVGIGSPLPERVDRRSAPLT
jgi:hypothetical protein